MPYAESDLVYNRAGSLSPSQKARLNRRWRQLARLGGGFVVVMLGVGVVFQLTGDPAGLMCTWVFAAIIASGLLRINRTVGRVQDAGTVSTVLGKVQRETEQDEGSDYYYLRVNQLRLKMDEDDYRHFEDGRMYHVYYVPRTNYVVSGEEY